MFHKITPNTWRIWSAWTLIGTFLLCKPSNFGLMLRLPQTKKSSTKSKKANGTKDFRNKGPLRFCLRLTRALSYRQVWANPQAVVYEHLSTVQGPNVQSSNNEGDYTSRRKNEFTNRLYPTIQDSNIREGIGNKFKNELNVKTVCKIIFFTKILDFWNI